MVRELFERGHAVAVLPYDPVRDEVVMLEQVRVGAMAAGATPWQLEIVAGMIDSDESPEQVAHREAREEAGLLLHQMEHVTRYLSSSGGCSEQLDVFIAIVDASDAEGIHGLDSENEDILVHRFSREQAYQRWLMVKLKTLPQSSLYNGWNSMQRDYVRAVTVKSENR